MNFPCLVKKVLGWDQTTTLVRGEGPGGREGSVLLEFGVLRASSHGGQNTERLASRIALVFLVTAFKGVGPVLFQQPAGSEKRHHHQSVCGTPTNTCVRRVNHKISEAKPRPTTQVGKFSVCPLSCLAMEVPYRAVSASF